MNRYLAIQAIAVFILLLNGVARAEQKADTCPKREVAIRADIPAAFADSSRAGLKSDARSTLFVATHESSVIEGLHLKFVQSDEVHWAVYSASSPREASGKVPNQFYGPVASIDTTTNQVSRFDAFIPVDSSLDRKLQLTVLIKPTNELSEAGRVTADYGIEEAQACPAFGRILVSAEDAASPENRIRVLSDTGEDVTDSVSESLGGIPLLRSLSLEAKQ